MATKSEWMKPAGYSIRDPLDLKRNKGRIVNPPRTAQLGGLDTLKEPFGHYRNDMTIKKPGTSVK